MSLTQAASFAAVLALLALAIQRARVQPFLALTLAAIGFGYAAGMSTSGVGKAFGLGFAQGVNTLGLIVVAAAFMAEIADASGATAWLQRAAAGRSRLSLPLALIGLIAGLASTPAAAFAVLGPLRRGLGEDSPRSALVLGLSLSGSHGLLILSPVMLASATILAADWATALAFGLPAALVVVATGLLLAQGGSAAPNRVDTAGAMDGESLHAPRRGAWALGLTCVVLIALLVTQSLGDIASEPLGGGSNREFLIALGRPVVLLLVGVGLLLLLSGHWEKGGLSEQGWAGRALAKAAPLVLLIGAAGGLSKIAQETGMAEMNAERLLGFAPSGALALLLPFALAAIVKTLQGSSLVAAITAAGMMMELVAPLGLGDPAGRALAALAIGAGAMSVSHVNDGLFWLVGQAARLPAGTTLARFSLATGVQGAVALLVLMAFRLLCH
ncbi:GntT/GntP/DsdX family permease [Ancylobacter amanitiformis]|uniref:GntP family gluconate:H+ symporter n=1 Tax=Ancylobacter amanitiformis TaxID=217069 RepID=A0ABU0LSR6_9HYPH|nr:GntP family permease [Ancylobacter amanitiformis]MDQ0511633.1 GntP family gluconate:H+ symporter [Ancylobacter amanitiformis]